VLHNSMRLPSGMTGALLLPFSTGDLIQKVTYIMEYPPAAGFGYIGRVQETGNAK